MPTTNNQQFICEQQGRRQRQHSIRPNDITIRWVSDHQIVGQSVFQTPQAAKAAARIVEYFQQLGNYWGSISLTDLWLWYDDNSWDPNDMLFGLAGPWMSAGSHIVQDSPRYLIVAENGRYYVTAAFIEACAAE